MSELKIAQPDPTTSMRHEHAHAREQRENAEITAQRLRPFTPACTRVLQQAPWRAMTERPLKLNWGFYPHCKSQFGEHGAPTQNGGAVLCHFGKANWLI